MACLGEIYFLNIFQILFFRIKILLRFYQTFSNFVSGFLNHQNIISKNKFSLYSQFFKNIRNFFKNKLGIKNDSPFYGI
jgi:transposase-like protein